MCFPADDNYESSALRSYPKARSPGSVYVLVMFDLCQLGTICFVFVFLISSVQVHRKRHGRSLTLTQLYQHISIYIACWSWPGCGYFICTLDSLFSYHFFFISYGRSSAECCFLDPVLSRTQWSSRRTKTNYVAPFFWPWVRPRSILALNIMGASQLTPWLITLGLALIQALIYVLIWTNPLALTKLPRYDTFTQFLNPFGILSATIQSKHCCPCGSSLPHS